VHYLGLNLLARARSPEETKPYLVFLQSVCQHNASLHYDKQADLTSLSSRLIKVPKLMLYACSVGNCIAVQLALTWGSAGRLRPTVAPYF
jgi:hypothetical protein